MTVYPERQTPKDSFETGIRHDTSLDIAMTVTSLSKDPSHRMDLSYILDPESKASQEALRWKSGSSRLEDAKEYTTLPLQASQESCTLPPMRLHPPGSGQETGYAVWQSDSSQEPYQSSSTHPPLFRKLSSPKTSPIHHLSIREKPRVHSSISSNSSEVSSSPSPTFSPRCSYRSSPPAKTHRISKNSHVPHSNKAYPVEQVDWIRYHHDDCGISWAPMFLMFHRVYNIDIRTSDQCLSSRYYRDNMVPMVDDHVHLMFDGRGKLRWLQAKVRDRSTPKGRALGIPYKLVDKHPERALLYDFVSEKDKELARQILAGNDPTDPEGKKARWRQIMRAAELGGHMPPPN